MYDSIERIKDECNAAIAERMRCKKKFAFTCADPLTEAEIRRLKRSVPGYAKQLKLLRNAEKSGSAVRIRNANRKLFESWDARLMAVTRATRNQNRHISYGELEILAKKLDLNTVYTETVVVRPKSSKPGSWRPIALSGTMRAAQQLMIRDRLLIQFGDNQSDSTVKGSGGEKQTFADLQAAVAKGYLCWVSLDVKDFFPSLGTGHLKGFSLSKWVLENLVFLPKETKITLVHKEYGVQLSEADVLKGECDLPPGYPLSIGDVTGMLNKVRRGLLQGDACAPQIARTFLGREIQRALENWDVAYGSHLDDLILGARSRETLKASVEALRCHLLQHPAGPLELHDHEIVHIKDGVEYLGYRAKLSKDGTIHVTPAPKRFNRFRERLLERWEASNVFTKEGLWKIGVDYATQWIGGQHAWTLKGPDGFSKPTESTSFQYLLADVDCELNKFIYKEWLADKGNWREIDIDFDVIGEQS